MPRTTRHRHAFSLLEMSIVVAIIGLVIGSLVAMRSYSQTAKINSTIITARSILASVDKFQSQYATYPGDMSNATAIWNTTAGNGNGDGVIGNGNNPEYFLAFNHLKLAGQITGNYTGTAGSAGAVDGDRGVNLPAFSFNGVSGYLAGISGGFVASNTRYYDGLYDIFLVVGAETAGNALPEGFWLKPSEAMEIDGKYDNGYPHSGTVRTFKNDTNCVNGTLYNVTGSTTISCALILSLR